MKKVADFIDTETNILKTFDKPYKRVRFVKDRSIMEDFRLDEIILLVGVCVCVCGGGGGGDRGV